MQASTVSFFDNKRYMRIIFQYFFSKVSFFWKIINPTCFSLLNDPIYNNFLNTFSCISSRVIGLHFEKYHKVKVRGQIIDDNLLIYGQISGTPKFEVEPKLFLFIYFASNIQGIVGIFIFIWETGYWTRAMKRFALFDLLKSLYSDTKILSKYIPSLQKKL